MGALGRVHGNGDLELALTIRTFAVAERAAAPLGRRRHRLGLRSARRGAGVADEGSAASRRHRGSARARGGVSARTSRRATASRAVADERASAGRGRLGARCRRAGERRRRGGRRGIRAGTGCVRDDARLRRAAVPARRAPRAIGGLRGSPRPAGAGRGVGCRALGGGGRRRGPRRRRAPRLLDARGHPAGSRRRSRSSPPFPTGSRSCATAVSDSYPSPTRAARRRGCSRGRSR